MSCDNDCTRPDRFPKTVENRPGLTTLDYRIGSYADLRTHMLRRVDEHPALAAWTHRLPDDPGIALIEAAAEVGDILSFYQDLYANEAYLGTAKWRDSVGLLVRLLGYRLAPGTGGRARLAFTAKGERPVTVPAGTGVKAQLDNPDPPAVLETGTDLVAYPALSAFHLYRPRRAPEIRYGTDTFTLVLGGADAPTLKAGDRVMVGVARDGGQSFDHLQVLVVDQVTQAFGDTVVKMKGAVTSLRKPVFTPILTGLLPLTASPAVATLSASMSSSAVSAGTLSTLSTLSASSMSSTVSAITEVSSVASVFGMASIVSLLPGLILGIDITLASTPRLRAWKLGASHRHFGHDAPATEIVVTPQGRAVTQPVGHVRRLDTTTGSPSSPAIGALQLPLDADVPGLAAGTRVLVEARLSNDSDGVPSRKRLLQRRVTQVERHSLAWGPQTGASSVLTLDEDLAITESGTALRWADLGSISIHEVVGEPFQLRAQFVPTAATRGSELHFHGTAAQAAALTKRELLFHGPGDRVVPATALTVESAGVDADQPGFHRVMLDREFDYGDFGHDDPPVTVHGNLVAATQGKTEARVPLGDGDARAVFQSFVLPKAPLTHLLDATRSPPLVPQVRLWVDGVEWTAVDSLFGRGPAEQVYIVREDTEGKSWVQFGDGKSGARLRTGRGNVVAVWRTGDGAHGPLKPDAKPSIDRKPPGLDAALLLEPVTEGAEPERADGARVAAPGTMQSLGRIVSLADHEAEALAIPGVLKARAAWAQLDGAPVVRVTLLTRGLLAADAEAAAEALRAAVRTRGAARCPVLVAQGGRTPVRLRLIVGIDPSRRAEDLRPLILRALGVSEGDIDDDGLPADQQGLFDWRRRQFGEGVHGSQVVAAVQHVVGVNWVRLVSMSTVPVLLPLLPLLPGSAVATASPLTLAEPLLLSTTTLATPLVLNLPPTRRAIACPGDRVLTLSESALQLQIAADKEGPAP